MVHIRTPFIMMLAAAIVFSTVVAAPNAWAKTFTIQVSAFKAEEKAAAEVERLKSKGLEAFFRLEDTGSKGEWRRVYVGRFNTKVSAINEADKLKGEGVIHDYTVRTIDAAEAPVSEEPSSEVVATAPAIPLPQPASTPAEYITRNTPDAWEIIIDLSGSTRETFQCSGFSKQEAQFTILRKLNTLIPESSFQAGLRQFAYKRALTRNDYTNLVYGMEPYDRKKFHVAISMLKPSDAISPLGWAIAAAEEDFANLPGKKALIILSDFKANHDFGMPLNRAERLHHLFGNDLNVYAINVGVSTDEVALAKAIAATSPNGRYFDGCRLVNDDAYLAETAAAIFGVQEAVPVPVCVDADGDAICDDVDQCPNTPSGAPVDDRGCWVAAYSQFFDYDKADLKKEFLPRLKAAAEIINKNPGIVVEIAGHTDSKGSEQYNDKLGLRRAESVKKQLVEYGVDESRLNVMSFGETQPIETNDTDEGRARNRRVEFNIKQPEAG